MAYPQPIALVTGASSGLGRALCLQLAQKGVHIVALARSQSALESLDDQIFERTNSNATLLKIDLTDSASLQSVPVSLAQRFGRLDYVVHAAASMPALGPAVMLDKRQWEQSMQVNVGCLIDMLDGLSALLRLQNKSKIVLFDDPLTHNFQSYWATYSASKAALRALALTLTHELNKSSVAVELCTPAPMATKLRGVAFPGEDRSLLASPDAVAQSLIERIIIS